MPLQFQGSERRILDQSKSSSAGISCGEVGVSSSFMCECLYKYLICVGLRGEVLSVRCENLVPSSLNCSGSIGGLY